MKLWLVCMVLFMMSVLPFTASADGVGHVHHEMTPIPANGGEEIDCKDADVPFGYYDYMHCTLHKHGTVQELMDRSNTSCCDGENSGECRATTVTFENGAPVALIDGKLCPIPADKKIYFDLSFPTGVQAMVCAAASWDVNMCPSIYCVAVAASY